MKSMVALFFVRVILAVFLAFLISWMFFPGKSLLNTFVLAAILLCLAYLFQYTRKRDEGGNDET